MSSISSEATLRAAIGPGAWLTLRLPSGAREETESALPKIEVAGLPGAAVVLRRGFVGDEGVAMRVACVSAPSDRWAPGVEELVLGRATAIARGAVPADLDRFDAGTIQAIGGRYEQRLEGEGRSQGRAVAARGRHILGFVGDARDATLCSIVCVEPGGRSPSSAGPRCDDLINAASPEGAFTEAPPPSAFIRMILLAAERPREAGVVCALALAAVVALVLARRPRPRP